MDLNTHRDVLKVREFLKQFAIIIYTGSQIDDIVLMDLELEDLYADKHLDTEDYTKFKLALRRAYTELEQGGTKKI